MIKVVTRRESQTEILKNQNKCILHFLDFMSLNLTKAYLKLAWKAGAVGDNNFYLVAIEDMNQANLLKLNEIFDFQRLLIATSPIVGDTRLTRRKFTLCICCRRI